MGALSRVLRSSEFRASHQLSAFLSFSVGRTLEGRGNTLKAYTIATEVLGRRDDFDPTSDPIVRVEATRLRRALERFYGGEGTGESIRIVLPRGGYAVAFELQDAPNASVVRPETTETSAGRNASAGFAARLRRSRFDERTPILWAPVGAMVFGLSFWISSATDPLGPRQRPTGSETALLALPEVSTNVPGAVSTIVDAETAVLEGLAEDLRDALVGIDGLKIRLRPPAGTRAPSEGFVLSLRRVAGETPRIVARLVCADDGVILWTAAFPGSTDDDTIVRSIAAAMTERQVARHRGECAAALPTALRTL